MAGPGNGSGGAVSLSVKRTIQSIKEVVGGHSEADILAELRESNMDPNETAQKLLYRDPFHEVRRKRDKKKEQNIGQRSLPFGKETFYQGSQWMNSRPKRFYNDQQRFYPQYQQNDAVSSREFRIVRDSRIHNVSEPSKADLVPATHSQSEKVTADARGGRSDDPQTTEVVGKNVDLPDKATLNTPYQSTSGPVSASSQHFKATGNVGLGLRQVVVANVTRQTDESSLQVSNTVASSGAHQRRETSNVGMCARPYISRGIQHNQRHGVENVILGISTGRFSSASQKSNKYHLPSVQTKVMQPTMEWKPKPTQKLSVESVEVAPLNSESPTGDGSNSVVADVSTLSNNFSHANLSDDKHVVIPDHLRVSESEQAQLRFGSFLSGLDSSGLDSSPQESETSEKSSIMDPAPVDISKTISSGHKDIDEHARYFTHAGSTLAAESDVDRPESNYFDAHNGSISADLGLVGSDVQLLSSETHNFQSTSSMPGFSEYDADANNDAVLFRIADPNVSSQVSPSPSEALGLVSRADSSRVIISSAQELQPAHPQSASQLYTQVHMPHYPNYMPYRHVFPPVYVPTMPVPNFSSNIAYPHPPNGSNFVQMPGGNPQLAASAMKYGMSQYKSVAAGSPTGYGNYTHPAGFTFSSPGVIGGTVAMEELNTMKYKDNGVYASNTQVDAADSIWMQSGRDIPPMQPSYYNLSGPATPTAAFVPTAGNQPFNATAQSSHAQFQGLYHPQQPTPIVGPHQMVHQQVAPSPVGVGGGIAVGVAGPSPQVGAYQQQQLGHLNWRPNF